VEWNFPMAMGRDFELGFADAIRPLGAEDRFLEFFVIEGRGE